MIPIYTDGACSKNGYADAKAGIGVFFGDNDEQKDILDSPDIVELSHPVENTDNEDLEVPSYLRKGNI